MTLRDARLSDRTNLAASPVLLSGTQALVRACLIQRARDAAAGHATGGYVTGYRGSPLGTVDRAFEGAAPELAEAGLRFHPGLNEDLAATALWGTQQVALRGEGRVAGVFGLWYGKGPGVDRSGDVFRHANLAGTAPLGGVLAAMGDDHTCESSTTCHQSELALVDAHMPILSPAGVQDLLDLMVTGWALSRYSGLWVGIKCVKDVVEATAVVDGRPDRVALTRPKMALPAGGLGIRLQDSPQAQEARLHDWKRPAALAFARANGLDRRGLGRHGARIGIVSAGKSWLDTLHALDMLGLRDAAEALGVTAYKVGMVWPLEPEGLTAWADGLDLVIVVEEKRALLETQVKEILYHRPDRPRVVGWKDGAGAELFPAKLDLSPGQIAAGLARVLAAEGLRHPPMEEGLARLRAAFEAERAPALAERKPWFCAGCPHNSSTKLPEGARAYAGIGCHYMVQWMGRETEGYTHMGAEGANWIGEAPFSTRGHVFQNLGDGTYNHSGLMAIRAAVGAGVNITYKILYNDAVAMTGGQTNDGGLGPGRIAREVLAAGVARLVAVREASEPVPDLPPQVAVFERERLAAVQRELAEVPGVSVLLYIQTCAAEKRRRRKRGILPKPPERVVINPAVCEGCGDCGAQSNCVAILPLETPLGRKRRIDQSACNLDLSCLQGFCPAFVTVTGATPKAAERRDLPEVPEPAPPSLDRAYGILITGIGGTGVVTIGAILSMAAHLEGKAASEMQMAGLAQKGGAVAIHCRLAPRAEDIAAVRLAHGEADAVLGGDLVVTAAPKTLALMAEGRTRAVLNRRETMTGQFASAPDLRLPSAEMTAAVAARIGAGAVQTLDATGLAERLLGDAIAANMVLLGAAWQRGLVPLSRGAIRRAIELNGAAVAANLQAFEIGRWAAADPAAAEGALGPAPAPAEETLDAAVDRRAAHLTRFQNARLARSYRAFVAEAEAAGGPELARAVAEGYFKLLAYKDEYEVARLHAESLPEVLSDSFSAVDRVTYHLAPPLLSSTGPDGRPAKRRFGPWMGAAFRLLRHGKHLRGTPFDPFGWTAERRGERRAIRAYRRRMRDLFGQVTAETREIVVALARLPLDIRGFGPVKAAAAERAAEREAELRAALAAGPAPLAEAAE